MSSMQQPQAEPIGTKFPITVSIYQNPEYVEGILQQARQRPLLLEFSETSEGERSTTSTNRKSGKGDVSGALNAGSLAKVNASVGGDGSVENQETSATGGSLVSSSKYTQSYYIHAAIQSLLELQAIREIACLEDAESLVPGEFVRFGAEFEPSQLIALLDIATPDLVERIVQHHVYKGEAKGDSAFRKSDQKAVESAILRAQAKASSIASIARAAVEALRIDFRSPGTREYYGEIGEGENRVTAVTVCDLRHFVTEDEDRILDGKFTVLGKVTSSCVVDEPILDRNKILSRLNPQAIDELVDGLNGQIADQVKGAKKHVDAPFSLELDSRISGPSFKVIPIAIYV